MIQLKLLLERVINEVGDLNNIHPHLFDMGSNDSYSFKDALGNRVAVEFQKYDNETVDFLNKNDFKSNILEYNNSYNVLYHINGKQSQLYKSDYKTLVKILKTILNIIEDFISKNDVKYITFYAANKDENVFLSKTDPQKSKLYKAILISNLKKFPNWSFADTQTGEDFKGFVFYKK